MIKTSAALTFFAATMLSGCIDVPPQAIVSDYNGASVKVQVSELADHDKAQAAALVEANRICTTEGKHRAEYASEVAGQDYTSTMLFLCL